MERIVMGKALAGFIGAIIGLFIVGSIFLSTCGVSDNLNNGNLTTGDVAAAIATPFIVLLILKIIGLGCIGLVIYSICRAVSRAMVGKSAGKQQVKPETEKSYLCTNCESPLSYGVKYCSNCGVRIQWPKKITTCPGCGINVPEGANYCPRCGRAFETVYSKNINR